MNLNQLKYFVSVAEHKSFSKAAQENFITQTAMTQQVRQLEEQMDTELIDRSVRPIRLTPAGEVFWKEAKAILERTTFAVSRAKEASRGNYGTLRVGFIKGYERSDLSNKLRLFHQQFPGIFVTCVRASSDKLAAKLLGGELDLIYSWDSTGLWTNPEVRGDFVENVPLIAAVYASHPLARRKSVLRSELKGEALLFMSPSEERDSSGDSHYLELYQRAGYTPNILMFSSDAESVLMMVAAEEGVSILPSYYTSKIDHADNLVFVPMEGEEEYERVDAFSRKDNDNQALKAFYEMHF